MLHVGAKIFWSNRLCVKLPPECTYMHVCVISVSQDVLDCCSCYVVLCVSLCLSLALCKYQKGQKARLHFPSLAKPALPIWTCYWWFLSQHTEVCLTRYWGSAIERGRLLLEMGNETQIGLAESQLLHYLLATHTWVSAHMHKSPMLCLAKPWQMPKRKKQRKEEKSNSRKIDCAAILKTGSRSSGILRILGYLLTTLSFKLLSSIIFNNPWVNTQMNCPINYWKEIYK